MSFASKLRKVLVAAVSGALALSTISAMPASAAGVTYATGDSIAEQSVSVITDLDANGQVTIPAGVTSLTVSYNLNLTSGFFTDNLGKTISISRTITGPNNTVLVQSGSLSIGGSPNFSFCEQNYTNCANSYSQTPPSDTMVVKANQVTGSASLYTYVSSYDQNANKPLDLAAGTYKFEIVLKADGVVVPVDGDSQTQGKVNLGMSDVNYSFFNVSNYTLGAGIQSFNMGVTACVDSAKISAGDVLTPTFYLNGNAEAIQGWDLQAITRNGSATNSRMGSGQATTFTVNDTINGKTYDDVTDGMAIRMNDYKSVAAGNLAVGSTYEWKMSIVNQNNVDVTGSCKPTIPGKPTLAYNSMQNRVMATISEPANFADMHVCKFYKATDLNTVVATSYAMQNMPNTPITCSLPTAAAGTSYVVKVYAEFYGVAGDFSAVSDSVLVPAPGYTVSPAVSGVTDVAGKVSVVSSDVDHITASSSTRVSADGKGGAYRVFQIAGAAPACPPNCGPPSYTFVVRQTTATGYVSDFAGTGTYTFTPTGTNTFNANIGWYGSDAGKWSLIATNTNTAVTPPVAQIEVVQGTAKSATTSTIKINKTETDATCTEAHAGSSSAPSPQSISVNAFPVSAPTAKQLLILFCYKAATMADNSTAYLGSPVVVAVDGENALTVVKALGDFSADVNSTNAISTTNVAAGSSDVAVTLFVTKKKVTAMSNGIETASTIAGRDIVRIKGDLTSTVTTAAWGGATGNASTSEPQLSIPQMNSGDFFVVQRVPAVPAPSFKLAKVSATGVMGSTVDITNDKSADLAITNIVFPLGVQSGSASAIQLVASVNPMTPSSPTKVAVLSVNTTTGAGKAGEIVTFTQAGMSGLSSAFLLDASTSDVNWWFTDSSAASDKMSIYKWRDHLYVKPVGPVPAVTSKNLEYATNTPAAGTKVTFTGTNLNLATAVKFGTVAATLGTKTATSLEVTVPAGTGTVAITIESANGNAAAGNFTYVGANKVAQTVTLDAGANTATVGDADRTLSATVSMVGYTAVASLTYSSTTASVCTVTGNKLKFVAKGTCSVKATQAGSSWTAEGVATKDITVAGPDAQTITIKAPSTGEKMIGPDGFFIYPSTNSGQPLSIRFDTPSVCKKGTYGATHVVNVKTGACKITVLASGNAQWLASTATLNYTVAKAGTTKITDAGNVDAPVILNGNGAKTNVLSEVVSWNKSTGSLTIASKSVWVGPITATATIKVGAKSYSCTVKYGTLKAASATSVKTIASPAALCSGKTASEKAALAALKSLSEPMVVKIVVVRDLRNPAKYTAKGQSIARAIYVTVG